MPSRSDIDPVDIPRLLSNTILIDIVPPRKRLRVRLVGTEVVRRFRGDYTGEWLDEIDFGKQTHKILNDYSYAAIFPKPLFSDHKFRNLIDWLTDIERVILPLSDDGNSPNMLFAVLDFEISDRGADN
jgi:hypothetical protein